MGNSKEDIIKFFDEHLMNSGRKYYSDFYVGITSDVDQRLFQQHNVDKDNMWWIYSTAENSAIAREVEKHYLDLGMRGGPGGGDNPCIVYAYVITPLTIE
jgi:hypothetical protein